MDELFIGDRPVLLGDGIPGFPGRFPQRDFELTECKSYSNGTVGLRYERMRTKKADNRPVRPESLYSGDYLTTW